MYVYPVSPSEQTASTSLYSFHYLAFLKETHFSVQVCVIPIDFSLQRLVLLRLMMCTGRT
jgi:hypothetical protein